MAKTLYLMRHAKSSWSDMNLDDFDRPLNERGFRDAPDMGKRLAKQKVCPDLLLSSPARRARETAGIIAGELGLPESMPAYDENIYAASCGELLQIVRSIPDEHESAMLIGHNPAMEQLVNLLADMRIESMPTCAVATLALNIDDWTQADRATGRLLDFDYPKKS